MGQKDRMKASDVFRETEYAFGEKVPFEKAFPEIKDLKVEVEESTSRVAQPFKQSWHGKENLGKYIDCSNEFCYNGGFSIGEILREMVRNKKSDMKTERICQGYEGSPKGRRRYRSCMHFFRIKVHIEYKE